LGFFFNFILNLISVGRGNLHHLVSNSIVWRQVQITLGNKNILTKLSKNLHTKVYSFICLFIYLFIYISTFNFQYG